MIEINKALLIFLSVIILQVGLLLSGRSPSSAQLPLIINTWNFKEANEAAWKTLYNSTDNAALEALVEGLSACERLQCDGTVGFGGSPDERGETTLDAMIMDGKDQNMGAVAAMKHIKHAAKVARHILENTEHSLLVGEAATEFAVMMGFEKESLATKESLKKWFTWFASNCQPNYWKNVTPDSKTRCGPYRPLGKETSSKSKNKKARENFHKRKVYDFGENNHDTIGMIVMNAVGQIYAGTSTNGATHKIPGRVGDSPIPGAGAYADNEVGAAVATGDGDIMMRFLPSALAVEYLRMGLSPEKAAETVLKRILNKYPQLFGAIVVADKSGNYGSACAGMNLFPFAVVSGDRMEQTRIHYKECIKSSNDRNWEIDFNLLNKTSLKEKVRKSRETSCEDIEPKLMDEIKHLKLRLQEAEKVTHRSRKETQKGD